MTPPAATAASAAPAVRPRRPTTGRPPRRVSGPLRPATAPTRGRAGAVVAQPGLVLGLLAALESLSQHRLLDRLIRGRVWIGLVAFALIGIVTLQLGLLELNGGIGRALEHEATLQRENAALSIENSELAAGTRVQSSAAKLGMASVPVGALRFLPGVGHGDVAKAAAALADSARAQAQAREASAAEAQSATSGEASESEVSGEGGEAAGATSTSSGESSEASTAEAESSSSTVVGASSEATSSSEGEPSGGISAGSTGE